MPKIIGPLKFDLIDFDNNALLCVKFREDSFISSFGDAARFHEEDGKGSERYLSWLKEKQNKSPYSVVHIWEDSEIIGQMELSKMHDEPLIGYINLFYIISEKRGTGLSRYLDQYAAEYMKGIGRSLVKLSVSPSNARAISYYKKMGYQDLGVDPKHPEVHLMMKSL
jgi:ribosomal protein S18 acetylase RimI-like enzyme